MGKLISLGEYNKLYNYIWIYLILQFIGLFVFDYTLVFDQLQYEALKIPINPFISISFNFLFYIIISLVIIKLQNFYQNKQPIQNLTKEEKLIFNEMDIIQQYGLEQGDYFLYINLFFVVATDVLDEIILKFKCSLLNYWMFEMFFYEIFNLKILKTKIYRHHIFSFIYILSSCSLLKTIVIIINFINSTENVEILNNRKWLIPIVVVFYFLFNIFKAYIYYNEKYYLEKRIISIPNYILLYGIYGIIASSICVLISTYIPCGDNTIPELSKIVCNFKDDEENYYFDSYIIYFKNLASQFLGLRIILIIIRCLLYCAVTYYVYAIYKKLSPIYHICMTRLTHLILNILVFINDLINKDINEISISINILELLIILFYISGSVVYLEFIELNFCKLNFYTRRNIKLRADKEFKISIGEINIDRENSDLESNEL